MHPFYDFICSCVNFDDDEDLNVENPMLLLLYTMAREELHANNDNEDATAEIIMQFRYDIGRALATLMS